MKKENYRIDMSSNGIAFLKRVGVTFLSAFLGAIIVTVAVLISGVSDLKTIALSAAIGFCFFALLGFAFPKFMIRVLFFITLFQPG